MGPITAGVLTALLYVVLPTVANEVNQGWGTNIRQRAEKLAKEIYTKLAANSQTRDKLMEAYQRSDNRMLSSLINQAGYSSQANALRKAMDKARSEYLNDKRSLDKENTELTNNYNKIVNVANQAGSSIAANNSAEQTLKEMNQLINGGYNEETIQQ